MMAFRRVPLSLRIAARLLPADSREEVLGDLLEKWAGEVGQRHWLQRALWAWRQPFVAMSARVQYGRTAPDLGARHVISWPSSSLLDWKLGFRMLIKYPGLSIVGGLALATVIGVAAGSFHVAKMDFFPDLGFEQSDRIVKLDRYDRAKLESSPISGQQLTELRGAPLTTLTELSAYRTETGTLVGSGRADRFAVRDPIRIAEMSASAFPLTRVKAVVGRVLTETDERPGAPDVIVLGYEVWQNLFDGHGDVIGREVQLGRGRRYTVVGVMPEGFGFPINHDAWTALRLAAAGPEDPEDLSLITFARLTSGATRESAQAELGAHMSESGDPVTLVAAGDSGQALWEPRVAPYVGAELTADVVRQLLIVGVVLFGCLAAVAANVATLVFARTAMRETEIVVRSSLGASRGRIIGQLFVESLVLSSLSAVVGLVVANAVMNHVLAVPYQALDRPYWWRRSFEPETVLFTAGVVVVGAALVALLPAIKATGAGVQEALKRLGARATQLRFGGIWTGIIVFQVVTTVVMLPFGVGYARDVWQSHRARKEFPAEHYLSFEMAVEPDPEAAPSYRQQLGGVYDELVRRLAREPGVEDVTFGSNFPGRHYPTTSYEVAAGVSGDALRSDRTPAADAMVDVRFFRAFDVPVLAGRSFNAGDLLDGKVLADFPANLPVIINESFARTLGGAAVGARIRPVGQRPRLPGNAAANATQNGERWLEVVGVVRDFGTDIRDRDPLSSDEVETAAVFYPASPRNAIPLKVMVKTHDPTALVPRVRSVAAQVDPGIMLFEVMPLDMYMRFFEYDDLVSVASLSGIILLCLLLSAAGLFAVMVVAVARRTREIGIRVALGATRGTILRTLFGRAVNQLAVGLAVGCLLFIAIAAKISEVTIHLLWPIAMVSVAMLIVGLIACAVPAGRALRIKPVEALRE